MLSKITHTVRLTRRMKLARLAEKMFNIFWQVILDRNPTFCFLCGKYIPPFERIAEFVKKPYKKSDSCHDSCWKELMKMEDITQRLNEESELICHLDVGWVVEPIVCRTRVKNNPNGIMKHLINHGWRKTPELVQNDIQNGKITKKQYAVTIKENPEQWFLDNQLIWSVYRNIHFLKPNGKEFPKVRDF